SSLIHCQGSHCADRNLRVKEQVPATTSFTEKYNNVAEGDSCWRDDGILFAGRGEACASSHSLPSVECQMLASHDSRASVDGTSRTALSMVSGVGTRLTWPSGG